MTGKKSKIVYVAVIEINGKNYVTLEDFKELAEKQSSTLMIITCGRYWRKYPDFVPEEEDCDSTGDVWYTKVGVPWVSNCHRSELVEGDLWQPKEKTPDR